VGTIKTAAVVKYITTEAIANCKHGMPKHLSGGDGLGTILLLW